MRNYTREERAERRRRWLNVALLIYIVIVFALIIYALSTPTAAPQEETAETIEIITIAHYIHPLPTVDEPELISLGTFRITAYCPCEKCCGKSPDNPYYGITSTGAAATQGRTIAVDPDVIPYGTEIYIDGIGWRTAEDCGGGIDGNELDLFFSDHQTALEWGVQYAEVFTEKAPEAATSEATQEKF